MAFTREARGAVAACGVMVVPDVIASSSSAAMVCLQMAHQGMLDEVALWTRIKAGVTDSIDSGLQVARRKGISLREAHILRFSQ